MATSDSCQAEANLTPAEWSGGVARDEAETAVSLPGKRAFDLVLSVTGLVVGLPLMALGAAAVRLESSGPLFCRSHCWGRGARKFERLQLRTAHVKGGSEGLMTRSGRVLSRLGVDRLPQLINVLRGEMSIVGPAPVAAGNCDASRVRHLRRFETEPGMTGLSELRHFGEPLPGSYISTDEIYRSSWSPLLDIAIVARSMYAVVAGAGCRGVIDPDIARG